MFRGGRLEHHPIVLGKRAIGVIRDSRGDRRQPARAGRRATDRGLPRRRRGARRAARASPARPVALVSHRAAAALRTARLRERRGTSDRADESPPPLLAALQALEARAGRRRSVANAARTLDLDIIAMGTLVREAPDPILPHPRAHARRFVLLPLADVAPGWVHPVLGMTVEALIAALPDQGVSLE